MSLFFSLLPVYLMGNFHCMSMCGPLVMMIGHHRYRYFYFLGRLTSFALAGLVAAGAGALIQLYLFPSFVSLFLGAFIFYIGLNSLFGKPIDLIPKKFAGISQALTLLMLRDKPLPAFLFGFFTVFLPCGQTLLIFSACALTADPLTGFANGAAFALLTSPSLFMAMQLHTLFRSMKQHHNTVVGLSGLIIGLLTICRGFADLELIPHLILNRDYHLVLY